MSVIIEYSTSPTVWERQDDMLYLDITSQTPLSNWGLYIITLQKTHAHRRLIDDVPLEVKHRRHTEIASLSRQICAELHEADVGETQIVLVESVSWLLLITSLPQMLLTFDLINCRIVRDLQTNGVGGMIKIPKSYSLKLSLPTALMVEVKAVSWWWVTLLLWRWEFYRSLMDYMWLQL